MQNVVTPGGPAGNVLHKVPRYLGAIRVWESLYALPFGYIGMVLAAGGWPGANAFIWITVAMFSARTLGMSTNRLVHHKEDIANPRTANRHLPKGLLKPWEVLMMMAVSTGLFFYATSQLNTLALALAPAAAAYVVLYSYAKYYTWACNLLLGLALSISPSAAWIAVTGRMDPEAALLSFAVAAWAGGVRYYLRLRRLRVRQGVRNQFGAPPIWHRRRLAGHQGPALVGRGGPPGPGFVARPFLLVLHWLGNRRALANLREQPG